MIFEHEIPSGSRLYFGESARLKRRIEMKAAGLLETKGYQEIVTPLFSYHQHESFSDSRPLIRLNDAQNHEVSLRADSTTDVVRIATRRLGRSTESKKWFYIQPVYRFPTEESYQIGVESLEGDFTETCMSCIDLLGALEIVPVLQVANIAIPALLHTRYRISLEHIQRMHLKDILASGYPWLERLLNLHSAEELEMLDGFPGDIAAELLAIREALREIDYPRIVISPLYYAKMRYYDSLMFRMFEDNLLFATGGVYQVDDMRAAGFALQTDACIAEKMQKGTDV